MSVSIRRISRSVATVLSVFTLLVVPLVAISSPVSAKTNNPSVTYPAPHGIVKGPDNAMWFAAQLTNQIGRMTVNGMQNQYTVPTAQAQPYDITVGSDGAMWFTEKSADKIGRIDTSGNITEYPITGPGVSQLAPASITAGPDGALWFTESSASAIGRITTDGSVSYTTLPYSSHTPLEITTGPDGNLWFTENQGLVAKMTPGGMTTEYTISDPDTYARGITAGPDGNVWFTAVTVNSVGQLQSSRIVRIDTSGTMTSFPVSNDAYPQNITNGPNGSLWFTEYNGNRIGSITPTGTVTEFTNKFDNTCPDDIAIGPDGYIWFTEACTNSVSRMNTTGTDFTERWLPPIVPAPIGLTNSNPSPTISWTPMDGAEAFYIYRNGNYIGFTHADTTSFHDTSYPGTGTYTYTVSALAHGVEGPQSAPLSVTIAPAPTAPVVNVTNPTANSTVSGTVNIGGTIYVPSGLSYNLMLYVFDSNSHAVVSRYQYALPASATTTSYVWDTTTVPNGNYTIILSAKDAAGHKDAGSTSTVKVTVQN